MIGKEGTTLHPKFHPEEAPEDHRFQGANSPTLVSINSLEKRLLGGLSWKLQLI